MKRLLLTVMLSAVGTGSMLFAAEPTTKPGASTAAPVAAAAKDAKSTSTAAQPAKADPAKADAKVDAKADVKPDAKADAKADTSAATKPAVTPSDDQEKLPPPSSADKGPSPQRFTPSEQVRADFDVSFPVDI